MPSAKATSLLLLVASLSGVAPLLAHDPVPESEPNDTPATADTAVLGGRVGGHSDHGEDVDYWVLQVNAGDTIYVDVDANEFHSEIFPSVVLFAVDGVTQLMRGSWGWDGNDQYLVYVAPSSGTYYVSIAGLLEAGHGPGAFYTINFRPTHCPVIAAEQEPNDSRATAKPLSLGSSVTALSCPLGDRDLYRISVTEPMRIRLEMRTPEQWKPVFGSAEDMEAGLRVYSADSTLIAEQKMLMGVKDSLRIEFDVLQAGSYFISAWTYLGGYRFTYTLSAAEGARPSPGDPVVTVADNLSSPSDIAVGSTGDLYVADGAGILRISPGGAVGQFVNGIPVHSIAFDPLGNLLAVGGQQCCRLGDGALYRIAPDGRYTTLTRDLVAPYAVAADPDGSIWVGEQSPQSLRHYDANGHLLAAYDMAGLRGYGATDLTFSPSGDLYVSTEEALYRFKNAQFSEVLHGERIISGFAFDANGRIYVANIGAHMYDNGYVGEGRIDLYDASGSVIAAPFARTPEEPKRIAFGRDSDGSPNRRLFFTDVTSLGEVKPGSIDVPGGRDPIAHQRAMRELLRPGSVLEPWERDALDARGNQNGRYDIGDLRMLLVRAGVTR